MEYQSSKNFYVGYSDIDDKNKCRLSKILDLLQNIATIHSEEVGYGTAGMMAIKKAWVVTYMRVKINKYPVADKSVEARTWSRGVGSVTAKRGYEVLSSDGEQLIVGDSHWALFDLETQKLTRVPEEMIKAYGIIDQDPFNGDVPPRLIDNKITEVEAEFKVGKRDIDTNHHMNNARYMDYICEILPDDLEVNEFETAYKKQIKYGEKIKVSYGDRIARILNEAGETCFLVRFN